MTDGPFLKYIKPTDMPIIAFFLFALFFLLLPGVFILTLLRIDFRKGDALNMTGLAIILGLVLITLTAFFLRFFGFSNAVVAVLPLVSAIYFLRKKRRYVKSLI